MEPAPSDDTTQLRPSPREQRNSGAGEGGGQREAGEQVGDERLSRSTGAESSRDSTHSQEERREPVVWSLWTDTGSSGRKVSLEEYRASLACVFEFDTFDEFRRLWDEHNVSERLTPESSVRVFQKPVTPVWEDPANIDGGKWLLSFPGATREKSVELFFKLCEGLVCRGYSHSDSVLGAVCVWRSYGCTLTLWNRDAHAAKQISKVKKKLRGEFDLPKIKYQVHRATVEINRYTLETGSAPPPTVSASLNKGHRSRGSSSNSERSSYSRSSYSSGTSSPRSGVLRKKKDSPGNATNFSSSTSSPCEKRK